jgi:Domain of unknown function (DUF4189)
MTVAWAARPSARIAPLTAACPGAIGPGRGRTGAVGLPACRRARASYGDPSKCPTEVSFFGTECGAFAYSRGVWAIVARDSITQAIETALADCRKRGNACRIIAAACADRAERTTAIK